MSAETNELVQHLQEEILQLKEQLSQEHAKAAATYKEAVEQLQYEKLDEMKHELRRLKSQTPGQRLADAGNLMVQGVLKIQQIAQHLEHANEIIVICETLVGPYKIIVADLSHEDGHDWGNATRNVEGTE